ncbi:hypothetical protein BB561_006247 [Smittium simulii]|uniref:tRNA (adenine(58)-N(1))-methyltransferase non-catalytic subunit TRM6 n=1 Tax=Smittium simulii TaxID=133385 RepID=A0A2T9Y5M5_9FUNG|nr:hypothetical protein BB561_006247 [Smittium simulii]
MAENDQSIIRLDDFFFAMMPSDKTKIIQLEKNKIISLGKFGSFKSEKLVGKTYGRWYEITQTGELEPFFHTNYECLVENEANNRKILPDNDSQKITQQEIEEMKLQTKSGEIQYKEIIKTITENNATFNQKTVYSQSKYLKKKESNICDHFFSRFPEKINLIRNDTLSQILSISNVHATSRTLVVDNTGGMIATGLLSPGLVYGLHTEVNHNYNVLKYLNDHDLDSKFISLQWSNINKPIENFEEEQNGNDSDGYVRGNLRRRINHEKLNKKLQVLRAEPFDGLVIATDFNPLSVLKALLPYLGGSRTVVFYSPYKESLLETFDYMRFSIDFLNVSLTESWLREYQVLPGRTHPHMGMSGSGGYLLSAIRVYSKKTLELSSAQIKARNDAFKVLDLYEQYSPFHFNNFITSQYKEKTPVISTLVQKLSGKSYQNNFKNVNLNQIEDYKKKQLKKWSATLPKPVSSAQAVLYDLAKQGDLESEFYLAKMELFGTSGFPLNLRASFDKWLNIAHSYGNSTAQFYVAIFYASGLGNVARNPAMAKVYLKMSADQNNGLAMLMLSHRKDFGIETIAKCEESIDLLSKIADKSIENYYQGNSLGKSRFLPKANHGMLNNGIYGIKTSGFYPDKKAQTKKEVQSIIDFYLFKVAKGDIESCVSL